MKSIRKSVVISVCIALLASMSGCVTQPHGNSGDTAAQAMDVGSILGTDQSPASAAQDWWYFFNDVSHSGH